jgi:hypothetical protein
VGNGYTVTALSFSKRRPSSRLYLGGSSEVGAPKILRLDDLNNDSTFTVRTITGADEGAYVHDIHVNPENGNELFVVLSNYKVESLWHSMDGGSSWSAVGGNLEGENGPSFRSAVIAPTRGGGSRYYAGTSIGLFMTDELLGADTEWVRTGDAVMGTPIIADLDYRESDDRLVAATHGRGMFIAEVPVKVSIEDPEIVMEQPDQIRLLGNYPNPFNPSTTIAFELFEPARVTLEVFDVQGRKIVELMSDELVSAGTHQQLFNASNLSSGTYVYRLQAFGLQGDLLLSSSRTMSLVK